MKNRLRHFLIGILAFTLILIPSCDMSNNSLNYSISGYVQKGPFVQGTEITVRELDSNLNQTGRMLTGTIDDNTGVFSIRGELTSEYVELSALGYYFNEITGQLSESQLLLQSVTKLDSNNPKINLNILTHLEKKRLEYLVDQGKSFDDAKLQAQREVLLALGFRSNEIDNVSSFEDMDISKTGQDNALLLASSVVLQQDSTTAQLSELLATIQYQIRSTGTIQESMTNKLINNTRKLNPSQIITNINNRYQMLSMDIEIPPFTNYGYIKEYHEERFLIELSTTGRGSISISPVKDYYALNDRIIIEAIPTHPWSDFQNWQGDITGTNKKIEFYPTRDMNISASFIQVEPKHLYIAWSPQAADRGVHRFFDFRILDNTTISVDGISYSFSDTFSHPEILHFPLLKAFRDGDSLFLTFFLRYDSHDDMSYFGNGPFIRDYGYYRGEYYEDYTNVTGAVPNYPLKSTVTTIDSFSHLFYNYLII